MELWNALSRHPSRCVVIGNDSLPLVSSTSSAGLFLYDAVYNSKTSSKLFSVNSCLILKRVSGQVCCVYFADYECGLCHCFCNASDVDVCSQERRIQPLIRYRNLL